jgi:hypothetical protein
MNPPARDLIMLDDFSTVGTMKDWALGLIAKNPEHRRTSFRLPLRAVSHSSVIVYAVPRFENYLPILFPSLCNRPEKICEFWHRSIVNHLLSLTAQI